MWNNGTPVPCNAEMRNGLLVCARAIVNENRFTLTHKQTNPLTHTPSVWMYLTLSLFELQKKGTSHLYKRDDLVTESSKYIKKKNERMKEWKKRDKYCCENIPQRTPNTYRNAWITICRSQSIGLNAIFFSSFCVCLQWRERFSVVDRLNKFMQTSKLCSWFWTIALFGSEHGFREFEIQLEARYSS